MFKKSVYIPNKANTIPKKREYSVERINIERAKRIENELKILVQSGNDLQNNYTPPEICDMMLDKLDLTGDKSILVLYTIEILFELRKLKYKGQVTFFTQSLSKKELAEKLLPGVIVQYIDIEENPLYFMENNWPEKFDIIIANPPYSKKLDLKFLDKAFDLAKEEVVFVHPATFIIDRKKSLKIYSNLRNKFSGFLKSCTLFNGNGIFGISLKVPCSITVLTKEKNNSFVLENKIDGISKSLVSEEIQNIFFNGHDERFLSIEKKINPNISLQDRAFESRENRILTKSGNFFVETSPIQGNNNSNGGMDTPIYKNSFFVILNKPRLKVVSGRNPEYNIWWEFKTEEEASNFVSYCKTSFARFCLSIHKMDQNLSGNGMGKVPWMDFTQEWTDEKLYKHFNITEEEQAFIKEVIPSYYD